MMAAIDICLKCKDTVRIYAKRLCSKCYHGLLREKARSLRKIKKDTLERRDEQ